MHYRNIHVKREQDDQKGEKFAIEVERALNRVAEEGYDVQSIVPVENSGFTVGVMIACRQRN